MRRSAQAQTYPSRPITMIVPFPAGGPTDTLARILGERMKVSLGQPVVVENVTGAGGTIGIGRAVQRGARRLHGRSSAIGPAMSGRGAIYRLPYDVLKDFAAGVDALAPRR